MADHGTSARAQQHYRDGEKPCPLCREAHRAKTAKAKRKSMQDPRNRRRHNEGIAAADMARRDLAKRHPDEYQTLYAKYLGQIRGIS